MPDSASAAHGSPTPAAGRRPGRRPTPRPVAAASAASTVSPLYRLPRSGWSGARSASWCSSRRGCPRAPCSGCTTSRPTSRAASTATQSAGRRRWCCSAPGPPGGWRGSAGSGRRRAGCWRSAAGTGCSWPPRGDAGYEVRGVELSRTGAEHARERTRAGRLLRAAGRCAGRPGRRRSASGTPWSTCPTRWSSCGRCGRRLAPGRRVRAVGAVLLLGAGPGAAVEVVDAQARATHLAFHPGHPAAGRRPGRPGDHLGDHLSAAAGERRPDGFAGRRRPGPARTQGR